MHGCACLNVNEQAGGNRDLVSETNDVYFMDNQSN